MKNFDKVIGYESVKNELIRIIDMMQNKDVYEKLGATVPNGAVLLGEPGVGKTLLANCFIKSSGRKCFTLRKDKSNGQFVNTIKDTFEKAKKEAPCIVFLDDLDKFANGDDGHRNSEEFVTVQSCMDDIKGKDVFVIATVNERRGMPASLFRAGRFDYKFEMKTPSGEDAVNIVKYYLSTKEVVGEVDARTIARIMNGHSCAALEMVVNRAGIYAGFERREKINNDDIIKACISVLYKAPESSTPYEDEVLKRVACHEAGHTIIAELLEPSSVTLVSVKSNSGNCGGFTSYYQDSSFGIDMSKMENRVCSLLAGKAATELMFGGVDIGASNDINKAYSIARRFSTEYCEYGIEDYDFALEKSNEYMKEKEDKIYSDMRKYYKKVQKMLIDNMDFLKKTMEVLIEKKYIMSSDIEKIKNELRINN